LPANSANLVFFDPQYEKVSQVSRIKNLPLSYQTPQQISQFLKQIARILKPSSFCLLWLNKNLLMTGQFLAWLLPNSNLKIVDLLLWIKPHFGFGSYLRNQAEFALLLQKHPINSKFFKSKGLGNAWIEDSLPASKRKHPHQKPRKLIKALIKATTEPGNLIVDPCAGSFVVLEVCQATNREFLGCDLTYQETKEFMAKTKQTDPRVCLDCWEMI